MEEAILDDERFEEKQKEITHEDGCVRRGVDEVYNAEDWAQVEFPRTFNTHYEWSDPEHRSIIDAQQIYRRTQYAVRDVGYVTPIAEDKLPEVKMKVNDAARLAYKCGFRYVKQLARGGYGITMLLEFRHQEGDWRPYVLKIGLVAGRDHGVMKELARAKHLVRRVFARVLNEENDRKIRPGARPDDDPHQPLTADEPCEEPHEQDLIDFDNDESLILMEYCRHGDLGQAIARSHFAAKMAGNTGSRISEPILWRLFKCLNNSIIGLAYPPMHQPELGDRLPVGIPVTESIPPLGERVLLNYVHFDIDPSNVFIGDLDPHVPDGVPVFKLGDFGTSMQIDSNFNNNAQWLWKARHLGKLGHRAPEQWSPHWECVSYNPLEDGIAVAGQYGSWTNVYQIAAVMFSAIVGQGVPQPPIAKTHTVPVANGTADRYTLGWELLEHQAYHGVSAELRELICDCLSLDPCHRPDLDDLSRIVDSNIQNHQMQNEDHQTVRETFLVGRDWTSSPTPWTPKDEIDPDKYEEEVIIEPEEVVAETGTQPENPSKRKAESEGGPSNPKRQQL